MSDYTIKQYLENMKNRRHNFEGIKTHYCEMLNAEIRRLNSVYGTDNIKINKRTTAIRAARLEIHNADSSEDILDSLTKLKPTATSTFKYLGRIGEFFNSHFSIFKSTGETNIDLMIKQFREKWTGWSKSNGRHSSGFSKL